MNIRAIYIGLLLLGIVSCAKEAVNDGCAISDKPIEIEVTDPSTSTRLQGYSGKQASPYSATRNSRG